MTETVSQPGDTGMTSRRVQGALFAIPFINHMIPRIAFYVIPLSFGTVHGRAEALDIGHIEVEYDRAIVLAQSQALSRFCLPIVRLGLGRTMTARFLALAACRDIAYVLVDLGSGLGWQCPAAALISQAEVGKGPDCFVSRFEIGWFRCAYRFGSCHSLNS
jgi:hypothetical protein